MNLDWAGLARATARIQLSITQTSNSSNHERVFSVSESRHASQNQLFKRAIDRSIGASDFCRWTAVDYIDGEQRRFFSGQMVDFGYSTGMRCR